MIHKTNEGLSVARNTALDIMTGDLCAFLDSDDAYDVTILEKLLTGMLDSGADMAVCTANEGISLIENANALGLPIPQFLKSRLISLKDMTSKRKKIGPLRGPFYPSQNSCLQSILVCAYDYQS